MSFGLPAYTAGRIAGVVTRPLFLYAANNFLSESTAQAIAIALLASSLGLVVSAADPHRNYYASHFSARQDNAMPLYVYLGAVFVAATVGALVAFGVTAWFTGAHGLAALTALLFCTDKLADEIQRFRLFERAFDKWGKTNLMRATLQIGSVGIAVLLSGREISAALIVAALAIAQAITFVPQIPTALWSRCPSSKHAWRLTARGAGRLWSQRKLWLLLILGAVVGYLDRGLSMLLDPAQLPLFMLVVMAFSVVQMSVDFFYISRHRRDFLEHRIHLGHAICSHNFLKCLAWGIAAGAAAVAAILLSSRGGNNFPLSYVVCIALLQVAIATTALPQQILYWHHCEHIMMRLELLYFSLIALGTFTLVIMRAPNVIIFYLLVAISAFRLIMYALAAQALNINIRNS